MSGRGADGTMKMGTMTRRLSTGVTEDVPRRGIGETWMRFWFEPADARPLAVVRILACLLGLVLWWSYCDDLQAWFGPQGVLPVDVVEQWRSRSALSLYDQATTAASLRALFGGTGLALVLSLLGVLTPVTSVAAAILWASLLNRGPMLAGPADDCLAVLLWCLAIGPSGRHLSIDRWLADRRQRPQQPTVPQPTVRSRIALSLVQVHASAITAAALLSQAKGDAWWDGSAAWWLAARAGSAASALAGWFAASEYLMNLCTHAVTAFEAAFAIGLWFRPTRQAVARLALVAWPLVGLLAGEPWWGAAMAIMAVPSADLPWPVRETARADAGGQ